VQSENTNLVLPRGMISEMLRMVEDVVPLNENIHACLLVDILVSVRSVKKFCLAGKRWLGCAAGESYWIKSSG
jgi:hypothetical protein